MPTCLTKICLILLNIFKLIILSIRALKKELWTCLYGKVSNSRTDQHPHTKTFQKGWLLSELAAPSAVTLTFRLQSLSWLNLQWQEATLSGRGFSQHWPRCEGSLLLDWSVFSGMCVCVDVCVWGSWQALYGMIAGLAPEGREIWRQQVDSRREVFSANGERGFKSAGVEMTLSISTSIHPSSLPQMNWSMDP